MVVKSVTRAEAPAACAQKGGRLADVSSRPAPTAPIKSDPLHKQLILIPTGFRLQLTSANWNDATTAAFKFVGGYQRLWVNSWNRNSHLFFMSFLSFVIFDSSTKKFSSPFQPTHTKTKSPSRPETHTPVEPSTPTPSPTAFRPSACRERSYLTFVVILVISLRKTLA